jgi:hypothetical protein
MHGPTGSLVIVVLAVLVIAVALLVLVIAWGREMEVGPPSDIPTRRRNARRVA